MSATWQEVAAVVVVFAAAGYVAWRVVRFVRRKGMPSCGGCANCAAAGTERVLVGITKGDSPIFVETKIGTVPVGATGTVPVAAPPKMTIPDDPGRRGVVGMAVRDGRMLVIRRSRSVVAPLVYCFPGGGIEGDETEEEALVREFREEVGVTIRPVRRLWQCVTAWKVDLAWWLVEMEPDATPVGNPREVESIHWFTPEEMAGLPELLDSNLEFLELLRKSHFCLGESA